jgi:hypothetical protein
MKKSISSKYVSHTEDTKWPLDECIYNFLVSEANKPKSYQQIFEAVTTEGPFQCINLIDKTYNEQYYAMLVECAGICQKFNYLHKHYNGVTKQPYLMFSTDHMNNEDVFEMEVVADNYNDASGLVRYMIDHIKDIRNIKLNEYLDGNNTITHMIAKFGEPADLERLMSFYDIDLEKKNRFGQTALALSESNKNSAMITAFVRATFEKQIDELKQKDSDLKKQNSTLLDENITNIATISILKHKNYRYMINLILAHFCWFFIYVLTIYYFIL